MMAVILVLMALFVLSTPYLLGIGRADRESQRVFDRTAARLALDDAARHARARLDATHSAVDSTPYWDSEAELMVDNALDPDFINANNSRGVMWDLETRDLSGMIDLGSASPGVIANLIGQHTWLAQAIAPDDSSLGTVSTRGFPESGFLWVEGERMAYLAREGSSFEKLARDLFSEDATAGAAQAEPPCDFSEPKGHGAGAPVLGLAAVALSEWRIQTSDGKFRIPADHAQVASAFEDSLSMAVEPAAFAELAASSTPFGMVGAGRRWQRGVRLVDSVLGGEDCVLKVDDATYFNPGTTIEISSEHYTELALVRFVRGNQLVLQSMLKGSYETYGAVVRPLARRPVNVNTASPEVLRALFLGLKLQYQNARITDREADQLVEVVIDSRPFTGFEDFLGRVVLPAAGAAKRKSGRGGDSDVWTSTGANGFIDSEDAEALYRNGLNANDRKLEFSTMPFAFSSRGVFEMSLRSSINAKSGVERASLDRSQTEVVVPQKELLKLWARQEDFDEELRLTREASHWATGPNATSRSDQSSSPPSRFAAHVGTLEPDQLEGELQSSFASRDDEGWAQLWSMRSDDEPTTNYHDRNVEHLDDESSDLEGLDFTRGGAFATTTYDEEVRFSGAQGDLLQPFSFSMWMKPKGRSVGALYFDLSDSQYLDSDRISVIEEAADMVVRVIDPAGDHGDSELVEQTEVRVPIEHFPLDTWTHLAIDVRGSRPDQVTVFVDGMERGETNGLTRLTSQLGEAQTTIQVESTDGFGALGERCVVRIGDEIIEAEVMSETELLATPNVVGTTAGMGGRAARERERWLADGSAQLNEGAGKDRSHPDQSAVQLFGYSLPLRSEAPNGSTKFTAGIGAFAVAEVSAVGGGDEQLGDRIMVQGPFGPVSVGTGWRGPSSDAKSLFLRRADNVEGSDDSFLSAFNPTGGFALVVQREYSISVSNAPYEDRTADSDTVLLGGVELIRYSGISGNQLMLSGRGSSVLNSFTQGPLSQGKDDSRAFIVKYVMGWDVSGGDPNFQIESHVFVVPLSLPAQGVGAGSNLFVVPDPGIPEFAQITRLDSDRAATEWICYDEITAGFGSMPPQFIRHNATILDRVRNLLVPVKGIINLTGFVPDPPDPPDVQVPPDTGDGPAPADDGLFDDGTEADTTPGGGGFPVGIFSAPLQLSSTSAVPAASPSSSIEPFAQLAPAPALNIVAEPANAVTSMASADTQNDPSYWSGDLGFAEDDDFPLTRAVRSELNFRGVMGTSSHAHPVGTEVLPVFRIWRGLEDMGTPGAGDRARLMFEHAGSAGEPVTVHRAYLPGDRYPTYGWEPAALTTNPGGVSTQIYQERTLSGAFTQQVFVAMEQQIDVLLPPSDNPSTGGPITPPSKREMREVTRLVKFPTGELPRVVESIAIGGDYRGPSKGGLPDAVVDELEFGVTRFGRGLGSDGARGAAMVLVEEMGQGAATIELSVNRIRDARGLVVTLRSPLKEISPDGGLVRIGEEILAYQSLNTATGSISIAPEGRGMLGSEEQPHRVGETVSFLSQLRVTSLLGGIGASDGEVALANLKGWPSRGTLLIGEELLHFTRSEDLDGPGVVGMPSASEAAGAQDGRGGALFRGRYGTTASAHDGGAPVVLFPTRYLDGWADRADAPELAYFGFVASQPSAFWKTIFFEEREANHSGVRLGMLVRASSDVAWDADPARTANLWEFDAASIEGQRLKLGAQSDELEWRIFARYEPGAIDWVTGLSHGWKSSPELRFTGAEFVAPRIVLSEEQQ